MSPGGRPLDCAMRGVPLPHCEKLPHFSMDVMKACPLGSLASSWPCVSLGRAFCPVPSTRPAQCTMPAHLRLLAGIASTSELVGYHIRHARHHHKQADATVHTIHGTVLCMRAAHQRRHGTHRTNEWGATQAHPRASARESRPSHAAAHRREQHAKSTPIVARALADHSLPAAASSGPCRYWPVR